MSDLESTDSDPEQPLERRNEPLQAVITIRDGSTYQAEIWESRLVKVTAPIVEYVYWIMIIDPNFIGRKFADSKEDSDNIMNVKFIDIGMRNLEGFRFRHLAGNLFRIKFRIDSNINRVVSQDLTMYGKD